MVRKHLGCVVRGLCWAGAALLAAAPAARGDDCAPCRVSCRHGPCPPPYVHCQEGPPRLKFKCACPRPVCNPCNLEHFGYYQTCWSPWPFPPDWRHCRGPQPSQVLASMAPPAPPQPTTPDTGPQRPPPYDPPSYLPPTRPGAPGDTITPPRKLEVNPPSKPF